MPHSVSLSSSVGGFGGRRVEAAFDGGALTSDAGALLLQEADRAIGLIDRVAACFGTSAIQAGWCMCCAPSSASGSSASRWAMRTWPTTMTCVSIPSWRCSRMVGAAPFRLCAAGRQEHAEPAGTRATRQCRPLPQDRTRVRSKACSSTCSSMPMPGRRARSSSTSMLRMIRCTATRKAGYRHPDCYCYLPLYVFCGRHLLAAKLRRSNIDASAGAVEEVARIVAQLRARW